MRCSWIAEEANNVPSGRYGTLSPTITLIGPLASAFEINFPKASSIAALLAVPTDNLTSAAIIAGSSEVIAFSGAAAPLEQLGATFMVTVPPPMGLTLAVSVLQL